MADIYENIVIGNFLFMLGHAVGNIPKNGKPSVLSVNLLQQTPMDKTLGDVLMESSHFVRLIEFKRTQNKSNKEESKLELITGVLQEEGNKHLLEVSRKIHWYIEAELKENAFKSWSVPYLDFLKPNNHNFNIDQFIKSIVEEMTTARLSKNERNLFKEYIVKISNLQVSSGSSSGGLALWMDETGGLNYLPVSDIRHLSYTIENILEKEAELSVHRQRLIERQLELERGPSPSSYKGRSH